MASNGGGDWHPNLVWDKGDVNGEATRKIIVNHEYEHIQTETDYPNLRMYCTQAEHGAWADKRINGQ